MTKAEDKAQSVARHRAYLGCPADEFAVALTHEEAMEQLQWMAGNAELFVGPDYTSRLRKDIKDAVSADDPWRVLTHFRLLGFEMVKLQ